MIRIKLTNWNKGRNSHTFRPFLLYSQHFQQIGVQFVEDGDYDFEFVGMSDFLDKKKPLEESIKMGIENLRNKQKPYFLFDGSDSTSLMAAYEVLRESNATFLYKNQLLSREEYKKPSAFNKWFFGTGTDLDLSYDISQEEYEQIRLSGWNLGYYNPSYLNYDTDSRERDIDICAIYQGHHPENYDHGVRNDILYTDHRIKAWSTLEGSPRSVYKDKKPYEEYISILRRSKLALSPFGMGEVCFRDFEIIQFGSIMIKPDMSGVKTVPNVYIPYETYIPCKYDWSDLNEVVEEVLTNWEKYKDIPNKARKAFQESFSVEKLLLHWYNEIKTYPGII